MAKSIHKISTAFLGALTLAIAVSGAATGVLAAQSEAEKQKATKQLFQAVSTNDLAKAQLSVGDGADVQARDRWGMTPADIAIDRGHYRIAHFLVSVRNIRRGHEAHAAAKPAASAGSAASKPAAPAPTTTPTPAQQADSLTLAAGTAPAAAWPAGRPNPFDPSVPAPGSQLRADGGSGAAN